MHFGFILLQYPPCKSVWINEQQMVGRLKKNLKRAAMEIIQIDGTLLSNHEKCIWSRFYCLLHCSHNENFQSLMDVANIDWMFWTFTEKNFQLSFFSAITLRFHEKLSLAEHSKQCLFYDTRKREEIFTPAHVIKIHSSERYKKRRTIKLWYSWIADRWDDLENQMAKLELWFDF